MNQYCMWGHCQVKTVIQMMAYFKCEDVPAAVSGDGEAAV